MTKRRRDVANHPEVRKWVKLARGMGWTVARTANGHLSWKDPDSEQFIVTASDPNPAGFRKDRQKLVDYGLPIPGMALPGPARAPLSESGKINTAGYLVDLRPGEDDTTCPCGREFVNVESALLHRVNCESAQHLYQTSEEDDMDRDLNNPPARERLSCPECSAWFWISQPHRFALHLRVDHNKAQCPLCLKFLRYDYLTEHMNNRCPKRPAVQATEPERDTPMAGEEQEVMMPGNVKVVMPMREQELERLAALEAEHEAEAGRQAEEEFGSPESEKSATSTQPAPLGEFLDGVAASARTGGASHLPPEAPVAAPRAAGGLAPLPGTPTVPAARPTVPAVAVATDASDDDLWELMELILDEPVMLNRETMTIVTDWQNATRRLLSLRRR